MDTSNILSDGLTQLARDGTGEVSGCWCHLFHGPIFRFIRSLREWINLYPFDFDGIALIERSNAIISCCIYVDVTIKAAVAAILI